MPECKRCKKILKDKGIKGMTELGYRPKTNRIKMRRNYPFGDKGKVRTIALYCKNCKGTKFV